MDIKTDVRRMLRLKREKQKAKVLVPGAGDKLGEALEMWLVWTRKDPGIPGGAQGRQNKSIVRGGNE